jgi:hypothetical protein
MPPTTRGSSKSNWLERAVGVDDRRLQPVGQRQHLGACRRRAVADEERYRPRLVDEARRGVDVALRRQDLRPRAQGRRTEQRLARARFEDVLRDVEQRDAARAVRGGDRFVDLRRRRVGGGDRGGVDAGVAERLHVVGRLQVVDAGHRRRNVAGNRQHRRMVVARFVEAGEQMRRARPGRSGADAETSADLGLTGRRQSRALLVAHAEPANPFFAPDRVGERVQRVADDAEHLADSGLDQGIDEQLPDGLRHVSSTASAVPDAPVRRPAPRRARAHARGGQLPPDSTDVIVENSCDGSTGLGRWTP